MVPPLPSSAAFPRRRSSAAISGSHQTRWTALPGYLYPASNTEMCRQAGIERAGRIKFAQQLLATLARLTRPIRRQRSGQLGLAFEDHAIVQNLQPIVAQSGA